MTQHQRLLIIDFGSQVTQLIARRLREAQVYCEIHPCNRVDAAFLADFVPQAVILSGGPGDARRADHPRPPAALWTMGVPVLGIGYGQQVMMAELGGSLAGNVALPETGRQPLTPAGNALALLDGWFAEGPELAWMAHGAAVTQPAPGFGTHATAPSNPHAVVADPARHFYGLAFHPEVHHTTQGARLLANFTRLTGFTGDWTMASYRDEAITRIREQVGDGKVICALSGGVDSSVTAMLIHEAVGDQLTCVLVDHGLMRLNEAAEVVAMFRDSFNLPLIHLDESERFLTALDGVADPEAKRKTIGRLFIEVFEEQARALGGADFLGQGTLYPDVIESVSVDGSPAVAIKSHHNVGGLPEKMGMKLVEPLRELFKDEVRALGRELGLPARFIGRHPFPGPGLAVRCPGPVTRERLDILRQADAVFIDQIRRHGLYDDIWQAFAAILPLRTVGVKEDKRTYDHAVALRAVTSIDGMTADSYPFTHEFLTETMNRIIREVDGVNRVFHDVTSKPPGTIELE